MRSTPKLPTRPGRRSARPVALAILLAAGLAAGCENPLEVEVPSQIPEGDLQTPENADLLVNGAIADFDCALGAYAVLGGMTSDELTDATQTADRWVYDRRDVRPDDSRYSTFDCTTIGTYSPLSTARYAADNALDLLEDWTDEEVEGRSALIATAAAYSGYSHLLLGEGFCSVAIGESAELDSEAVFERAEEKFTRAIQTAREVGPEDPAGVTDIEEILNMALVGRARARLDMGRPAEAAEDAREVAEDFERLATASAVSERRRNRIWVQNDENEAVSVGEPFRDLTWQGQPDPRVEVVDGEREATDGTPLFFQTKYGSDATPIPIASWDEAQLIIAEAEGGQEAVDIIQLFHERAGLPPFSSSDEEEIREHVIQERERELFLEGQRFFDKRRLGLPFDPPEGTPFDNGGFYGDTRCWPLPDVERNNNPDV